MNKRTNCLDRAGQILITCLWIEKRLVDFVLLYEHPEFLEEINTSSAFPEKFTEMRLEWWKKDFGYIKKEFVSRFMPKKDWDNRLEWIMRTRNAIAHGQVSLYRSYLLYKPCEKRNDIDQLKEIFQCEVPDSQSQQTVFLIEFSKDEIYSAILRAISEVDEKYFKYEADKMGLNFEKIR